MRTRIATNLGGDFRINQHKCNLHIHDIYPKAVLSSQIKCPVGRDEGLLSLFIEMGIPRWGWVGGGVRLGKAAQCTLTAQLERENICVHPGSMAYTQFRLLPELENSRAF